MKCGDLDDNIGGGDDDDDFRCEEGAGDGNDSN